MAEGCVSAKTYWAYFKAGDSFCGISFLATAFLVNQILISSTDYWLSIWTSVEETRVPRFKREFNDEGLNETTTIEPQIEDEYDIGMYLRNYKEWDRNMYIYIYAGLACIV